MAKHYYNTTGKQGEELRLAVANAKSLEDAIMDIYLNSRLPYGPSQILRALQRANRNPPITSVRRAITNLTTNKHLVKTTNMVMGLYNEEEHKWQINSLKYPATSAGEQTQLFTDKEQAA